MLVGPVKGLVPGCLLTASCGVGTSSLVWGSDRSDFRGAEHWGRPSGHGHGEPVGRYENAFSEAVGEVSFRVPEWVKCRFW